MSAETKQCKHFGRPDWKPPLWQAPQHHVSLECYSNWGQVHWLHPSQRSGATFAGHAAEQGKIKAREVLQMELWEQRFRFLNKKVPKTHERRWFKLLGGLCRNEEYYLNYEHTVVMSHNQCCLTILVWFLTVFNWHFIYSITFYFTNFEKLCF